MPSFNAMEYEREKEGQAREKKRKAFEGIEPRENKQEQQRQNSASGFLRTRLRGRRKKPLNIYHVTKKVRRDYERESEREREYEENKKAIARLESQRRYARSRSGRVSRRISAGMRFIRHPAQSMYRKTAYVPSLTRTRQARGVTPEGYPRASPQFRRGRFSPTSIPRRDIQRFQKGVNRISNFATMQQQQNQNYFDWVFSNFKNPQFNAAQQLELEVHRAGSSGVAHGGDFESRNVDKLAFNFGNCLADFNNPAVQIEKEVCGHALVQHINPISNIEQEVLRHANILNPQRRTPARRTHRRRRR